MAMSAKMGEQGRGSVGECCRKVGGDGWKREGGRRGNGGCGGAGGTVRAAKSGDEGEVARANRGKGEECCRAVARADFVATAGREKRQRLAIIPTSM